MPGTVEELWHYPIKGLSAQPLTSVTLEPGQGFPLDRAFGLARPGSGFDPNAPRPLPKTKFVVLARDAKLATLETFYNPATNTLSIAQDGDEVSFDISTEDGRAAVTAFVAGHVGMEPDDAPTLYSASPHRFTDVSVVSPEMMNAVSLINRDSVALLSDRIGAEVSPARFRGNIVFSGIDPMAELDWVDQDLSIGAARLKVVQRTRRCPATQVNLKTGERDLDIPVLLRDHFGHSDMGVYAQVIKSGTITPGDLVSAKSS